MTTLEHVPREEEILDFIDDCVRQIQETGVEARYIIVGPASYDTLRKAVGRRFRRGAGTFETYNYIPVVVDPFRTNEVAVVPAPAEILKGTSTYRVHQPGT